MAKLSIDLSQFKAAGVYTIELDQSQRVTVTNQSLRLLPGFAKRGPFNAPVFIRSTKERQRFYGDRDKKLERKGSFFHLSIDTALLQSPVFAINLLNVNQDPQQPARDTSDMISLSVDSNKDNRGIFTDKFVNYFNKERFWKADPEYLFGVAKNHESRDTLSASLFQLANVGTTNFSVIIRKARVSGYDVFAKDWYGNEDNIPFSWIRPYDKIKDYFVQIIVIEGNWDNYNKLAADPYYAKYFTPEGIKPDMVEEFMNLPATNLIGSWIGTFIPEFRDHTGANQYLEDIVNGSTQLTGVLLNINKEALDQLIWNEDNQQWESGDGFSSSVAEILIDLVGHQWADASTGDINSQFLSYDIDIDASTFENDFHKTVNIVTGTLNTVNGTSFEIDASDADSITIGSLVRKDTENGEIPAGVTYVVSKNFKGDTGTYVIETAEPIFEYETNTPTVTVQKPIDDESVTTHYLFHVLKGLKINSNHLPGYDEDGMPSIEAGLIKIYSMLEDPGISRGLLNPDMIQYRYVVDTMAYGLQPELGGKAYLSRLAKKRGKTTALISAPSIKQFAASVDPYFCDIFVNGVDPKPIFNTKYIPLGGNPDMPRSWKFTFPSEDNGGKYCGVFGPFLRYVENGVTYDVPPAADVSNTYIKKFLGGDPYAIVANQNGILSNPLMGGVEYMLDKEDRGYLEEIGYNSIIERINTGQIMIYSNATSYQTVKSDYNKLHVRELLNTIEIQIDSVLQQYVFSYNNPVMRLNVVNSISPILQAIQDSGALERYEIVMDETNNTPDIVDEGFAIIDIGVWINKGMEKIINRITVNRNDGTSSGGFTAV